MLSVHSVARKYMTKYLNLSISLIKQCIGETFTGNSIWVLDVRSLIYEFFITVCVYFNTYQWHSIMYGCFGVTNKYQQQQQCAYYKLMVKYRKFWWFWDVYDNFCSSWLFLLHDCIKCNIIFYVRSHILDERMNSGPFDLLFNAHAAETDRTQTSICSPQISHCELPPCERGAETETGKRLTRPDLTVRRVLPTRGTCHIMADGQSHRRHHRIALRRFFRPKTCELI